MKFKQTIGKFLIGNLAKAFNFNLSEFARLWDSGGDLVSDSAGKATSPYQQVSLVFTCINALIDGVGSLPLVLSTVDEKIVESGPVYELLFNNPKLSWEQLVTETIGHFALEHDVFWVFTDEQGLPVSGGLIGQIKNIVVVPGSQMHPVTSRGGAAGELVGWKFWGLSGRQVELDLSEVHQWKGFNPYDRFHGLGAVTAAKNEINYDFAATLHNASALANGAEPGAIITVPGRLDEDQANYMLDKFDHRHKGPGKPKRTAIVTNGGDIKSLTMSLADLEVAKITELTDKKICSAFGVPPGIAGLITEAQYSHGPAMRQFIFNTIIPLAACFAGHITSGIVSRFTGSKVFGNNFPAVELSAAEFYNGRRNLPLRTNRFFRDMRHKAVSVRNKVFAWFDSGQHPTVQEYQQEVAEKVLKSVQSGVPLNQLIAAHDLPYEEVPWGDDWWISMGQVPARYVLEAGIEGITGPSLPEGEPQGEGEPEKTIAQHTANNEPRTKDDLSAEVLTKADERHRLRIWNNWKMSWAGIEREYHGALRTFFVRQQRILIAKLRKVFDEQKNISVNPRQSVIKINPDEIIARVVFDLNVENNKIKVINHTFFEKASELGIRQVISEALGLKGDKLAELVKQAKLRPQIKRSLLISSQKITGINRTTQNLVAGQLQQGLDAGEGITELSKRISSTLGGNLKRAQYIARTQTAGAVGTGRHAGMKQAGVKLKTWLSSRDNNVRSSHRTAESRYAEGISLDVPFVLDAGTVMYPGDPNGPAAEIINCRCVELLKTVEGKSFDLAQYANLQFYSYSDMVRDKAA